MKTITLGGQLLLAALLAVFVQSCSLDSFLFDPIKTEGYILSDSVIPAERRLHISFESDGESIHGFYITQADTLSIRPHHTILYHHGNEGNIEKYWWRLELLYRAGFDVLIYDYRGYGMSTGVSESEATLLSDGLNAHRFLMAQDSIDTTLIVHYGYSLGAVPAIHLARRTGSAYGVIVEAGYASGEALVQSGTLLNIPGSYLLKGDFNNVGTISMIGAPLLMMHGIDDGFIPITAHGDPLYAAAVNPKTYHRIQGAGHSDLPNVMGQQYYIDVITAFIRGS